MRKGFSSLFLLGALALPAWGAWTDAPFSRDPAERKLWQVPAVATPAPESLESMMLAGVIRFYQWGISSQDGPVCPMYPTCSAFGFQAIRRYGPLQGTLMAADRILRDNPHAHSHYARTPQGERLYLYDPVEDHILW